MATESCQARDLPSRRRLYWTMRFFAHDSARHFAVCTRALEAEFYPGLPIFTNWNVFSGRLYVPGPVANNADKQSPDAAMGGHDWLEFGGLRGGTMLRTEDWFADSLDEDDLSPQGLKPYRVLYVTEPNIPGEGQQAIVDWVRAGGLLATVSGAGQCDRYDEPCDVFGQATGVHEQPRPRLLVAETRALKAVGNGMGKLGALQAVGVRSVLTVPAESVVARFDDGSPAVAECAVGRGRVVPFGWMPGLSYWNLSRQVKDGLPSGFSKSLR